MNATTRSEIEALQEMTLPELREKHAEVCGEPTTSKHKDHVRRKVEWALQAREHGGLSERARRRAQVLAQGGDLRLLAPQGRTEVLQYSATPDRGLPPPGTILERVYKGRVVAATILDDGVEYEGERYESLTAVAEKVTGGSHQSGPRFFGLRNRGKR